MKLSVSFALAVAVMAAPLVSPGALTGCDKKAAAPTTQAKQATPKAPAGDEAKDEAKAPAKDEAKAPAKDQAKDQEAAPADAYTHAETKVTSRDVDRLVEPAELHGRQWTSGGVASHLRAHSRSCLFRRDWSAAETVRGA